MIEYQYCTDKRCIKGERCRQARDFQSEHVYCLALKDPKFANGVCPFYKTKKQFAKEYAATNKYKIDPYMKLDF